mmetsp:Transcript_25177/g.78561  ORF Transcript_25177/g.78561 Transcript_25177/m.78561 type:complete len:304 (-) Transcript_25177:251-1162(-)
MRRVVLALSTRMASSLVVPADKASLLRNVPKLVELAQSCSWNAYDAAHWEFLINGGCESGWIVPDDDDETKLLGCFLRADFGRANGLGAMLVSPRARGRGLGKALMAAALDATPADRAACPVILASCSPMGQPMYEKMGYEIAGPLTFLKLEPGKTLPGAEAISVTRGDAAVALAALDRVATGLDRAKAVAAILGVPGATSATARDAGGAVVGAAAAVPGGGGPTVVGPLLGSTEVALPLLSQLDDGNGLSLKVPRAADDAFVTSLVDAGFEIAAELNWMTYEGASVPGDRDLYLGLLHPTLG